MNRRKRMVFLGLALLLTIGIRAGQPADSISVMVKAGYNIGAATPLGIPATIRELRSFELTPSFVVGIDLLYPLRNRWGVLTGVRFENKGMDVAVTTKGYHMAMVKGGEQLEGLYTGRVEQKTKAWMITLPVMASYRLDNRWRLHAGPYVSLLTSKSFAGNVADGYLRKDTPTGQKIEMGHAMEERATYDFSDHMRHFQFGLQLGAKWRFAHRLDLAADLSWGLTGIMHSSFKTVEQTLYPIYGTLAVAYQIK